MVDLSAQPAEGDDTKDAAPEEYFKLVNTARSVHTRATRRANPTGKGGLKQHIGGGEHRVLRGRPLILSGRQIEKHIEEIGAKARAGLVQVHTMDGRVIPAESLRARPNLPDAPAEQPSPKMPVKRLDSAKDDKNLGIGEELVQMPGGIPLAQLLAGGGNTTTGGIPGPLENETRVAGGALPEDTLPGEDVLPDDPAVG